ncbi:FRG domain-containing protein [Acetobacterium sp. K1/6]|uniref:FRG domain-containing protein n=1 Tax=Acetobacterium sp. K1/6 TaxID=3055467 RepID=UPI002ACA0A1B|nr:FRG domain-containing protein [Acetobacterium sp. K1/6]MDZ5726828.1 FRG domain-containing protein [Acetobacterium sp. K1/6]
MTNQLIINSLSAYIDEIEKFPSSEFLYRGEAKEYRERTSSALRQYKGTFYDTKEYPFSIMLDDFYREVTPVLSNVEHENFIAFAQHYGIPTPLIDVTKSPLVALYFACQNETEENGYVYLFEDNYIDITKIIQKYPNQNVLEELFVNNEKDFLSLLPVLEKYYKTNKTDFDTNLSNLLKDYHHYFSETIDAVEKQLIEEIKKDIPDLWMVTHYLKELDNSTSFVLSNDLSIEVFVYLNLARSFFRKAYNYGEPIWWINFLPNLMYRPIMKFDRGLNQRGLFLYQSYASYVEEVYSFRVQMVQRIRFKKPVFIIKNKEGILKSLDNIGINRMALFKDYDNTAAYIKSKHEMNSGFVIEKKRCHQQ